MSIDSFNGNQDFIISKLESTPGVAETLTQSDYDIFPLQQSITFQELPETDLTGSKTLSGRHGERAGLTGIRWGTLNFTTYYRDSGNFANAYKLEKLLQSCGLLKSSITTGYSYTSIGIQNDIKTITFEIYKRQRGSLTNFKKTLLSGCMGNCSIYCEGIGSPIFLSFQYKGKLIEQTDETTAPDVGTGDTNDPLKYISSFFVWNGIKQYISTFNFDFGNKISPEITNDSDEETGISYFRIMERSPRFNFNPLDPKVSIQDILNIQQTNTEYYFQIAVPTVDPKFILYAPALQIESKSNEKREGLHCNEINFTVNRNGDNSVLIDSDAMFEIIHGNKV